MWHAVYCLVALLCIVCCQFDSLAFRYLSYLSVL